MNCRQLMQLLCDYIADELPPELRQHIHQHLQKCPPCVAYVDSYRATIQLTRKLPCKPPPPELMQRLQAALEAHLKQQPPA
jgi:anti-sigma factor RsiW